MADPEQDDSYYHPAGVPVTPQAKRLGYEFPVYVSKRVWSVCCVASGVKQLHKQSVDLRVFRLLQYCYEGMAKKLVTTDDFLWYDFKIWFWARDRPNDVKQKCARLGARLFLDPSTGGPWLYIFDIKVDSIDVLKAGVPDSEEISTQEAINLDRKNFIKGVVT